MRFQFPFLACFHELTLAVTCWAMPHVQATWQAQWGAVAGWVCSDGPGSLGAYVPTHMQYGQNTGAGGVITEARS